MKRPWTHHTLSSLATLLRLSSAQTLRAIREAGITLTPTETHYTDTRPRKGKVRHWRPLTNEEVDQVIRSVRGRQGARELRRQARAEATKQPTTERVKPT